MDNQTRKGLRLHIGIFGRRNTGKSSLLNAITRQDVSIVADLAGTTTDPVEKPMELQPLGPVVFIDTAGVDDIGALGQLRIAKTKTVFDRVDLALIVTEAWNWGVFEEELLSEFIQRGVGVAVAFNKLDTAPGKSPKKDPEINNILNHLKLKGVKIAQTSSVVGTGIEDLRQSLFNAVPKDFIQEPDLLTGLIAPGELAVFVVPIDKEAPKGRLILPQVQAIRNVLDHEAYCIVVKERELKEALGKLVAPPKIVVTDSQAFLKVAADVPKNVWMTSFSILMSRMQGDLVAQVEGARKIDLIRPGDKVLIAEACSHHPIAEDIGRVKIPRWLNQYVGGKVEFHTVQGHDFPENLDEFKLVIHCGACMFNRREMMSRILRCKRSGVPITNYGLAIAFSLGIFDRALEPFECRNTV